MKYGKPSYIFAIAVAAALTLPGPLTAQQPSKHHIYRVIDLGTFGGPNSYLSSGPPLLNNQGAVVGEADTNLPDPTFPYCLQVDCFLAPAFEWQNGTLKNLGALAPGANSFGFSINSGGHVAGLSENGVTNPLTGFPETRGVLWQDGAISDLGTLGGYDSIANAINERGQVVGGALNTTPDDFSNCSQPFPYPTQVHAVRWQRGAIRDLGTLGGNDSCALFINERGEVAGFSYTGEVPNSTTGMPTQDPFLWNEGQMIDLGTLGGTVGSPNGLNNQGQVAGQSNLAGDATHHAFLWDRGVLTDLGTFGGNNSTAFSINDAGEVVGRADLPGSQTHHGARWKDGVMTDLGSPDGDACSTANYVNSDGQIVGDAGVCLVGGRGWLWENGGPIVDLNTLVIPGSGVHVAGALQINDRGEIVAEGVLANGGVHAVLLVPQGDCDDACETRIADSRINPTAIPIRAMMAGLKANMHTRFPRGSHLPNSGKPSN